MEREKGRGGGLGRESEVKQKPLVGVIMGSDSDLPVMQEAGKVLAELRVPAEIKIVSAHRTPDVMYKYAKEAHERGLKVIIAGAGGAAHLPGMVAAITHLPVIGVPVESKALKGMDSLLSIVQMPPGIPVATVAINGAKNAGLLAAAILSTYDQELAGRLIKYKTELGKTVRAKDEKLSSLGAEAYIEQMNK